MCCCVEVLGLSLSRDDTRRLLKIALKAACMQGGSWQVRGVRTDSNSAMRAMGQQAVGVCAHVQQCFSSVKQGLFTQVYLVVYLVLITSRTFNSTLVQLFVVGCRCGVMPARPWLCWLPHCSSGRCWSQQQHQKQQQPLSWS